VDVHALARAQPKARLVLVAAQGKLDLHIVVEPGGRGGGGAAGEVGAGAGYKWSKLECWVECTLQSQGMVEA
jgi:hypothetical protein